MKRNVRKYKFNAKPVMELTRDVKSKTTTALSISRLRSNSRKGKSMCSRKKSIYCRDNVTLCIKMLPSLCLYVRKRSRSSKSLRCKTISFL